MSCPLPTIATEDLYQGVKSLIPKCHNEKCWYVGSDLDSDRMPSGCILMVVALLDKSRPDTDTK